MFSACCAERVIPSSAQNQRRQTTDVRQSADKDRQSEKPEMAITWGAIVVALAFFVANYSTGRTQDRLENQIRDIKSTNFEVFAHFSGGSGSQMIPAPWFGNRLEQQDIGQKSPPQCASLCICEEGQAAK